MNNCYTFNLREPKENRVIRIGLFRQKFILVNSQTQYKVLINFVKLLIVLL